MLSPTFFSAGFILMTLKSNSWPGSSLICVPLCSTASELWHKPSTPSAISTKAPKLASRSTLPWITSPTRCCSKNVSPNTSRGRLPPPPTRVAHAGLLEERVPDIRLELLHAQREPTLIGFDGKHDGLHLVALLQHFGRVLHALGPAQVADVDQPVDAVFDFDERTEVGQVADFAFYDRAHRELLDRSEEQTSELQ